jgi:hypothetical protein
MSGSISEVGVFRDELPFFRDLKPDFRIVFAARFQNI